MRLSLIALALTAALLGGCLSPGVNRKSDSPGADNPRSDLLPSSVGPRRE